MADIIIKKVCPICNEAFSVKKRNNRRYCSAECRKIGAERLQKEQQTGKSKIDVLQPVTAVSEDGFDKLCAAIVSGVKKDFEKARRTHKNTEYFERWFLSKWGQTLSGGNGENIIQEVRTRGKIRASIKKKYRRRNY